MIWLLLFFIAGGAFLIALGWLLVAAFGALVWIASWVSDRADADIERAPWGGDGGGDR